MSLMACVVQGQGTAQRVLPLNKVDLRASCFSLQIHHTNGNTFGTLLYLVSPWWQTVNH